MFRFRLQRVLELRQEAEQGKSRALVTARDAADEARRAHDELAEVRENSRAEVDTAQQGASRVGHLHQLSVVLQSLEVRLEAAVEQVAAADRDVTEAQGQLEVAARDRRVLDRLKERHADVWRAEEAHKDRLQMDEIALARFARTRDSRESAQSSSGIRTAGGNSGASTRASTRTNGSPR